MHAGFSGNDRLNPGLPVEGIEYIGTVGRVLRARGMEYPQWLSDYHSAIADHDTQKCSNVSVECIKARGSLIREKLNKEVEQIVEEARKAKGKDRKSVP